MNIECHRLQKGTQRQLAGVCAGFAEFLGWEVCKVRQLWAAATVLTGFGPGILTYAILAVVLPEETVSRGQFNLDEFRVQ